jgi:hypothetical protein
VTFSTSTKVNTSKIPERKRLLLALFAAVVVIVAVGFSAYSFHLFGLGTCGTPPRNEPSSTRFLLIISFDGYNGSRYHATPWPKMNVTLKQIVTIRVWNNDTQSHGFTINHYSEPGGYLRPSDIYNSTFQACQLGSFAVYDPSFVTNYAYLKAELNVAS